MSRQQRVVISAAVGALAVGVIAVAFSWNPLLGRWYADRMRKSDSELVAGFTQPPGTVRRGAAIEVLRRQFRESRDRSAIERLFGNNVLRHLDTNLIRYRPVFALVGVKRGSPWINIGHSDGGHSQDGIRSESIFKSVYTVVMESLVGSSATISFAADGRDMLCLFLGERDLAQIPWLQEALELTGQLQPPACILIPRERWVAATGDDVLSVDLLRIDSAWARLMELPNGASGL